MTEGCDGGWPLLAGLFGHSFPIPLESCAPYKESTLTQKCSDFSHCQSAVHVEDFYYIGGYYGASSELAMMKEIRARGPIAADLNVPLAFSLYKEGIFSDDHIKILSGLLSDQDFVRK